MNTPATLIVIFTVLYNFQHFAATHAVTQAMAGKFNKFSVNYVPQMVFTVILLLAAFAADTYL